MTILDATYFQGELSLPGIRRDEVPAGIVAAITTEVGVNSLEYFIAKYEPEFLKKLLGKTLYEAFSAGMKEDPIQDKWDELKKALYWAEGKFQFAPAANYVYFYTRADLRSITSPLGEKRGESDYARDIDEAEKLVRAWNNMVDMVKEFRCGFMVENWDDYEEYGICTCPVTFEKINTFGI